MASISFLIWYTSFWFVSVVSTGSSVLDTTNCEVFRTSALVSQSRRRQASGQRISACKNRVLVIVQTKHRGAFWRLSTWNSWRRNILCCLEGLVEFDQMDEGRRKSFVRKKLHVLWNMYMKYHWEMNEREIRIAWLLDLAGRWKDSYHCTCEPCCRQGWRTGGKQGRPKWWQCGGWAEKENNAPRGESFGDTACCDWEVPKSWDDWVLA